MRHKWKLRGGTRTHDNECERCGLLVFSVDRYNFEWATPDGKHGNCGLGYDGHRLPECAPTQQALRARAEGTSERAE